MLTIKEHSMLGYGPRTHVNALDADITIAFAMDFTTAGEKLTHKASAHIIQLDLRKPWKDNARVIYSTLNMLKAKRLNIAGNGIYTLAKHGMTQEEVNAYVYRCLKQVYMHYNFDSIRSGGQTGVDIAGAVAGVLLCVDTTVLLPKGFVQRGMLGVDREHTEAEIREQIMQYVRQTAQITLDNV